MLIAAVAAGSSAYFTTRRPPTYEAEARVLVEPIGDRALNMETEHEIARSNEVTRTVLDRLDVAVTAPELLDDLSVETPSGSDILVLKLTAPSLEMAREAVGAFATAYLDVRRRAAAVQRRRDIRDAEAMIELLTTRLRETERRLERSSGFGSDPVVQSLVSTANVLTAQLVERRADLLKLERSLDVGELLQPAVGTGDVGPSVSRNAILGALLGCLLGIAQAAFRGRLDDRLRTVDEAERAMGSAVLAVIPSFPRRERTLATLERPPSVSAPTSEAFAALRVGVLAAAKRDPTRVLLVASARRGEGRTTTAAHLAISLARVGHRVTLICADPRRHRLERLFGVPGGVGLADVVRGYVPVEVTAVPTALERLTLVPCGLRDGTSSEPLHPTTSRSWLDRLTDGEGFILVDMPPLSEADAVGILSLAGGVLLVLDARRMREGTLALARRQLDRAGVPILGLVPNRVAPSMLVPVAPWGDRTARVEMIDDSANGQLLGRHSPRTR